MARPQIKLDRAGMDYLAKVQVRRAVELKTQQIAAGIRGMGIRVGASSGSGEIDLPVKVDVVTTDRAHGLVTIAHPAGLAVQGKYGALTKAAAQAGLEVKS